MTGTRPTKLTIENGLEAWDADANDNFGNLMTTPSALAEYASEGALPSAALYRNCVAFIENYNSMGIPAFAISDGAAWNFFPVAGDMAAYHLETAAYEMVDSDVIVLCSGTWTFDLLTAVGREGRKLTVKNVGTGTITVDGYSTETIDGATTKALTQNKGITIMSDGTEWWIISEVA